MKIEDYVRAIVRPILFQRTRIDNLKNIKDLISHLKAKSIYISYPSDKIYFLKNKI